MAKLLSTSKHAHLILEGHTNRISLVKWSPNGTQLASGSLDNTIKIWDVTSGKVLHNLIGHEDNVRAVAWSPDGKYLASGSWDRTIRIWDVDSGELLMIFTGHASDVASLAWSPEGTSFATGSGDNTVKIWAITGQELRTLIGHTSTVTSIAFSPDGTKFATGSADKSIKICDYKTGSELRTLKGHKNTVFLVEWSGDNSHLVSCSNESINIWDTISGQHLYTLMKREKDVIPRLPDEKSEIDYGYTASWNPYDAQIATGSLGRDIKIWDSEKGHELQTLIGNGGKISSVAWSPDGKYLASGSWDFTIRIWNLNLNEEFCDFCFLSGLIDKDMYLYVKEKTISEATQIAFDSIDTPATLGQLAFLPKLKEYSGNSEKQKEFLLALRSTPKSKIFFWNFLEYRGAFNLGYLRWTIKLYQLPEKNDILHRIPIYEEISIQKGKLSNRKETVLNFQLVVEGVPYLMHPLIKSIIIGLETDRGDLHELKFTNFYFQPHPFKNYPEYQDTITFKIDPGYSRKPEAILNFTGVIPEYENALIPRRSTRVEKMLELLLKQREPSSVPKEELTMEDTPDPEEWFNLFDKFKKSWQEPNFPIIKLRVGGFIGKWAEALLAGLVLAASFPGIIQFIMRLYLGTDVLPIFLELISYVPVAIILIILTVKFAFSQRKSRK